MTTLSNDTLNILKNFSDINPNLVVKPGNSLSTIAEAKNIFAVAEITETFESQFGIYDLNEFINVVNLVDEPELSFNGESVTLQNGKAKASYRFADESILTSPQNEITMPSTEVNVSISGNTLTQIRSAARVMNHAIVSLKGEDGVVTLAVVDPKNPTANTFSIILDEDNECKSSFDLQFLIANLKVLSGDYNVKISSKLISEWINTSVPVKYYIALEKTSTYN